MISGVSLQMLVKLCVLMAAVMAAWPALAQTQIGSARTVVRDVTGTLGDQVRTIVIRDNVFRNEVIETRDGSAAEIVFRDGTKVSVGPNAKLVLDEFVFNPDEKSGAFKMNLLQGAAKFVTGNLSSKDKSNFEIATPTVTIAVRGTVLDVVVDLLGATATRLDSQSIIDIANQIGATVRLNLPDTAATSTPAGDFEDSQQMPEWAMAAILELDNLLVHRPRDSEDFAIAPPPPTPPQPQVVIAPLPPPPPPPPEDPEEKGLDQAQSVASDTALNGGLTNNAVGVADHSAQGLSAHGGGAGGAKGGASSGGGGKSASAGGSQSSSASSAGGSRGKSGSRGRGGGGGQQ